MAATATSAASTRIQDPGAAALMAISAGVAALLGLGLSVFLVGIQLNYSSRTAAYDSAPVCTSPAEIGSCRYQGAAQIVRTWTASDGFPDADLKFTGLGGRTFTAYLDKSDAARTRSWENGQTVDAEVWQGEVSVIDGIKTLTNPDTLPNDGLLPGLFFVIPTLVLGSFAVWSALLYRRRAAALSTVSQTGLSTAELPLTAAMTAYLQTAASRRKDLAAGVFARASGNFPVLLYPNRYGDNKVSVVVAGRPMTSTVAEPLEALSTITGEVDYLPASRTLLEVRDRTGAVLWSRLAPSQAGSRLDSR